MELLFACQPKRINLASHPVYKVQELLCFALRFMAATNAIGLSLSGSNSDIEGDDGIVAGAAAAGASAAATGTAPGIRATSPRPLLHIGCLPTDKISLYLQGDHSGCVNGSSDTT